MKQWLMGGLIGACTGVAAYLVVTKKNPPPPVEPPPAEVVAVAPTLVVPVAPVVLAEVVEVTDVDSLLDPPARSVVGVPFDPEPVPDPIGNPPARERIPPAVD